MIEARREWISYEKVHLDAVRLADAMQRTAPGPVAMVAAARGGWLPARVVGAVCDERQIDSQTFSVSVNYDAIGTVNERAVLKQGLDSVAVSHLTGLVSSGYTVWVIDGPLAMGNVIQAVQRHVNEALAAHGVDVIVRSAVLHWVTFDRCTPAPWRKPSAVAPDVYARHIVVDEKPYIDYPWEYSLPSSPTGE